MNAGNADAFRGTRRSILGALALLFGGSAISDGETRSEALCAKCGGPTSCGWVVWSGSANHSPYWFSGRGFDSLELAMAAINADVDSQLASANGQNGRHLARRKKETIPSGIGHRVAVEYWSPSEGAARTPPTPAGPATSTGLPREDGWRFWYQMEAFPVGHNPNHVAAPSTVGRAR